MSKKKIEIPAPRPYVLVCNDDGIVAPGIAALICALQPTCDLIVVAPDGPRSGGACSITCTQPVSYRIVSEEPGMKAYACSGTPVDCVKMGLDVLCDRKPDLLVSGVNLGNNASICTFYSGTIGATIEGCIKGVPSIGFSLDTFDPTKANYAICTEYIVKIVDHVLKSGLPPYTLLNVNFPAVDELKGIRVCRMAMGDWVKEYEPVNCPRGGNYYWMTGEYELHDKGNDHDMSALADGYVSIVPQRLDMTDYDMMKSLKALATPEEAVQPTTEKPKKARKKKAKENVHTAEAAVATKESEPKAKESEPKAKDTKVKKQKKADTAKNAVATKETDSTQKADASQETVVPQKTTATKKPRGHKKKTTEE